MDGEADPVVRVAAGRSFRLETLALYVLLGGVVSLLGWILDVRQLTDWGDDGISIQPNTCVAAALSGAAVLLLRHGRPRAARILGAFVLFLGSTVVLEYLFGWDFGIDTLLMFDRTWGRGGVLSPGRMGPAGATCWTLLGLGIIAASYPASRPRHAGAVLALVAGCISGLGLVGYLYGSSVLYSLPRLTVIALQTASFIFCASLALIIVVPEGPMRLISSSSAGGVLSRRLLPALVLFPLAIGFVLVHADRLHVYDAPFSNAVRTIVEIVAFVVLLWFCVAAVDKHAQRQLQAERGGREAKETAVISRNQLELELRDTRMLQGISTELVSAENSPLFYDKILEAAARVMRSDFASLQTLYRGENGEALKLLAHRGFSADAVRFWESVGVGQACACGTAFRTGQRVVVSDIETCSFMAGSRDLEVLRSMGVAAVQSTPLVSRSGAMLGMISTHWREKHAPEERELRLLDILARQAADWIERTESERQRATLLTTESAARAEAERAARLKDEFLATLSHELRTPLTSILGWAHVMKSDPSNPDRVRAAAETIERNGRAQAQLITDLLDISRIVAGTMRLDVQAVDLVAIIDAAVDAVLPAATAKELRIEKVTAVLGEPVYGDPARLQQVLWNLLSNSVKFTPRGGRIEVVLARTDRAVELRVTDDGAGIAPEFMPHVFDRFRQGDASTSRQHGGLGLGLAIVKEFTELHGGSVRASSEGVGRGSTFVIELPVATIPGGVAEPRERAPGHDAAESAPPPPELDGVRVLVIDDDADTLVVLRDLFAECGALVGTASSARTAMTLLAEERFDIIVSDIGMPGGDGYGMMTELRTRGIRIPAIALTAFARAEDRKRALGSGFQEHVTKPVEPTQLLGAVARLALTASRGSAPLESSAP